MVSSDPISLILSGALISLLFGVCFAFSVYFYYKGD